MQIVGLKKINQRQFSQNIDSAIEDYAIIEEPLLISLCYLDNSTNTYQIIELTLVMRTPNNDDELIAGFLFNERIINNMTDIIDIEIHDKSINNNHVIVKLAANIQPNWQKISRSFPSQSSCGICGKTSLNADESPQNED